MDVIDRNTCTAKRGRAGPGSPRGPMTSSVAVTQTAVRWLAVLLLLAANGIAATDSPVQVDVRPFGLEIVDTVKLAGSDAAAAQFQSEMLPGLAGLLDAGWENSLPPAVSVDPAKLDLATAADLRVYFVSEDAAYHNTLGFNTEGGGITSGNPLLIFPDATTGGDTRTDRAPLLPGDFVDLGSFEGDTELDFFLIADGRRRPEGRPVYSTDRSVNPDGIEHAVAYALLDSPYLLMSFEDVYRGGDQDYNDLIFAVDIGADNVAALSGVPEPATVLTLAAFAGIVACAAKRRRGRQ